MTHTPTQTKFSTRAVIRTVVQVVIPAAIALTALWPVVVNIIIEQGATAGGLSPEVVAFLTASAGILAAISGGLARLMALPQVEAFLQSSRFLSWLAAEPPSGRHVDSNGDGVADAAGDLTG